MLVGFLQDDVPVLRLLAQARASGFRVVQDVSTREVCFMSPGGGVHGFPSVGAARRWLRGYGECGVFGRRCVVADRWVCPVHGEEFSS